jgi:hypothetical protein
MTSTDKIRVDQFISGRSLPVSPSPRSPALRSALGTVMLPKLVVLTPCSPFMNFLGTLALSGPRNFKSDHADSSVENVTSTARCHTPPLVQTTFRNEITAAERLHRGGDTAHGRPSGTGTQVARWKHETG